MILALWLDRILLLASLIVWIPAWTLFLQITASALRSRGGPQPSVPDDGRMHGFAVLMPAHDEAAGIEGPVRSVLAQCGPRDRLLVVADNCDDATAAIARSAGAEVIERYDASRRGKGYALDFGVRWLERDPPALVIVVDADCIVAPHALERIASRCLASGRPVQALYLMHAPPGAGLGTRIAQFAWIVKNKLRPLGNAVIGWPCQLMGTGMAFPWVIIRRAPLATGHLVEDMQLGLDLASAGTPPIFCENALVTSMFPLAKEAVDSQRARWEHGHLSVIASAAPRLLWQALSRGHVALLAMVLDAAVPPLAALVLLVIGLLALDLLRWMLGGSIVPVAATIMALSLVFVSVMTAWWLEGRRIIGLRELCGLPLYIVAKIPVYVRVFTKRQVEWVRTRRDDRRH